MRKTGKGEPYRQRINGTERGKGKPLMGFEIEEEARERPMKRRKLGSGNSLKKAEAVKGVLAWERKSM